MLQAIETWEEKAKICRDALENAWLHHEIGRAHLTLEHTQAALDSGSKSLEYADTAGDSMWQLRANLLIAQAQGSISSWVARALAPPDACRRPDQRNAAALT